MKAYINPNSPHFFAFNIWDIASAKSIMDAAQIKQKPIILQTSMKAFSLMDLEAMRFFVTTYAKKKAIPVYLHLDHCKKIEMIQEAIAAGWDSVMIDASDKLLDENMELTNYVTELAHGKNVLVESEVGQVSGVEDDITVSGTGVARVEDIQKFLKNTNVDMLAVAIGTAHGQYMGIPDLHYDLLQQTGEMTKIPLVIHGGTGLSDDTLRRLFSYQSVKKINISTDVKQAYRLGIERCYKEQEIKEKGFDPLKVTGRIHDSICKMAMEKLSLIEG